MSSTASEESKIKAFFTPPSNFKLIQSMFEFPDVLIYLIVDYLKRQLVTTAQIIPISEKVYPWGLSSNHQHLFVVAGTPRGERILPYTLSGRLDPTVLSQSLSLLSSSLDATALDVYANKLYFHTKDHYLTILPIGGGGQESPSLLVPTGHQFEDCIGIKAENFFIYCTFWQSHQVYVYDIREKEDGSKPISTSSSHSRSRSSFLWTSTTRSRSHSSFLWKTFGSVQENKTEGTFNQPAGVTFWGNSNYLYVCDQNNDRVQIVDKEKGSNIASWGSSGVNDGKFKSPSSIYRSSEIVYVGDSLSVQLFTAEGLFLQRIGEQTPGGRENELNWVWGLRVENDCLYVSDSMNKRIKVYRVALD